MSKRIDGGLTRNQRYYRKNMLAKRERTRERQAEWRARHPEESKANCRKYYAKNTEHELARAKARDAARNAAMTGTVEGRLYWRMKEQKRRARKSAVEATLTAQEWGEILALFEHKCAYCRRAVALEQDHVIPLSKGGPHAKENVIPACKSCNSSKGNRDRSAWVDMALEMLYERLEEQDRAARLCKEDGGVA